MWSRSELKQRAKAALKGNYWNAFVVTLICAIITGGSGGSAGRSAFDNIQEEKLIDGTSRLDPGILAGIIAGIIAIVAVAAMIGTLIRIFVFYPFEIGKNQFFIKNSLEPAPSVSNLVNGFKNGYLHIVGILFCREVFIFLWSCLFIIPGIIKSYEYRMVSYVLAENPSIDRKRAFEISREMMNGQKWNTFVLDLSFIGWYLLGCLVCGIGILFVHPYKEASLAELYACLRVNVLQNGVVQQEELPGMYR